MARRSRAIANLDIEAEGLAQPDGLAERLQRNRETRTTTVSAITSPTKGAAQPADPASAVNMPPGRSGGRGRNDWRNGKAMVQVALDEEMHTELSIIAKRRRMTLSQLAREAMNLWLETHGHTLRIR